jgi:hypothetical protein
MKKIAIAALSLLLCVPAFGQSQTNQQTKSVTVQGEIHLDARNKLGFDYPYQRWDSIHTAEMRLNATLPKETKINFFTQRKYFSSRISEANVEKTLSPQASVKVGLQRLPFGLYDLQETYRSGLIDYAMPRVDYGSSGMDQSVLGIGGTFQQGMTQLEGVVFTGNGVTVWNGYTPRRGVAGRVQRFIPSNTIVGLSYCSQTQKGFMGKEQGVTMGGIDIRYTRPYLVLRGEVMRGNLAGDHYQGAYKGGYIDAYYRMPGLPAWTLTARTEQIKPSPMTQEAHQTTLGARWTMNPAWTVVANWRKNTIGTKYGGTWTRQSGKNGDFLFQIYHTIPFSF